MQQKILICLRTFYQTGKNNIRQTDRQTDRQTEGHQGDRQKKN